MYAKNGTTEAEYLRKYRIKNPDKYRAQHNRDVAIKAKRDYESGKRVHRDECKCVECKMSFRRDDAHMLGFRFLGQYNCICNECNQQPNL